MHKVKNFFEKNTKFHKKDSKIALSSDKLDKMALNNQVKLNYKLKACLERVQEGEVAVLLSYKEEVKNFPASVHAFHIEKGSEYKICSAHEGSFYDLSLSKLNFSRFINNFKLLILSPGTEGFLLDVGEIDYLLVQKSEVEFNKICSSLVDLAASGVITSFKSCIRPAYIVEDVFAEYDYISILCGPEVLANALIPVLKKLADVRYNVVTTEEVMGISFIGWRTETKQKSLKEPQKSFSYEKRVPIFLLSEE